MYIGDNIDAIATGIKTMRGTSDKCLKEEECNVYGSKLKDIQEINRLKEENLELKLIIGEMQHKIFKLHKELDEKE